MTTLTILSIVLFIAIYFEVDWTTSLYRRGMRKPLRVGFTHDVILHGESGGASSGVTKPYMERWILWLPWVEMVEEEQAEEPRAQRTRARLSSITLRVHKFWSGDDDSAPHDHPWWFITFPLTTYTEKYLDTRSREMRVREVKRFRFHYRSALHRHIVYMPVGRAKPFYTLVVSGGWGRSWGFWPDLTTFVPWREWVKRGPIAGDGE